MEKGVSGVQCGFRNAKYEGKKNMERKRMTGQINSQCDRSRKRR